MKKSIKLIFAGLGLFVLGGLGFGIANSQFRSESTIVLAEGEEQEPEIVEEELPCKVVIDSVQHGSVSVSITEGNIGDICVVTAKHDLLYKIDKVTMNGVALIESETTSGEFSFALVEGENKISAIFVVDEELCGTLTNIVKEASEKDWSHLFTVENLLILVKWILDGGILIAVIRYYVKDKKLENKLENTVKKTIKDIIPETTKETVLKTIEDVITPMFAETKADYIDVMKALNVFAKCFALSQDNSVEAKKAILDELSGLKIGDLQTIGEVKKEIEELVARQTKSYEETLKAIKDLGAQNQKYVEGLSEKEEEIKVENSSRQAIE
ncbi:MAG: hypothetical protein K5765_06835 [Clostridia bacterium]|nr:hypothetical protein [Clostridia bacterium]